MLGEKFEYNPHVSERNKKLGRRATLRENPDADGMSLQDRLIQEAK